MKITVPNLELKVIELEKRVLAQAILADSLELRMSSLIKVQDRLLRDIVAALNSLDERVTEIEDDIYEDV